MKPGWKTSEFWLTLIANVGSILILSGALPNEHVAVQVIAGIVAGLSNLGYGISRGLAKH